MKKIFQSLAAALVLFTCAALAQTDNYIASGSASPYLTLGRSLSWGGSGFGSVGQNFIYNPLDPNQGFCVFIYNNNPSNSHQVTISVFQSGDPSVTKFANNTTKWVQVPTFTTFPITVGSQALVGVNYHTTASAAVTIRFTGNTTAVGSPDTADIFTVQTDQSSCGSLPTNTVQGPYEVTSTITTQQEFPVLIGGINIASNTVDMFRSGNNHGFVGDANSSPGFFGGPTGKNSFANYGCLAPLGVGEKDCVILANVASNWGGPGSTQIVPGYLRTNMLELGTDPQVFSGSATVSFFTQASTTNPAAGAVLLHQFATASSTFFIQFRTLILDCSAACELKVFRTTSQGTTCTALTPHAMNIGGGTRANAGANTGAENACTTPPTASDLIFDFSLTNVPITIDLSGFILDPSNFGGIMVQNVSSVTGIASVTLQYVQQ